MKNNKIKKKIKIETDSSNAEFSSILCIPELDLLKLTRAEAEIRAATMELTLQKNLKDSFLQKVDPQGILKQIEMKIHALIKTQSDYKYEYEQIRDNIGKKLNIDMQKCAYDDRTGVIHNIT